MKLPHFTQHGTRTSGDALDLFIEETDLLRQLFAKWNTTTPERTMGDAAVTAKWDHGTIGKLLLEHAAVRLAAGEDIARVLQEIGRGRESSCLEETNHLVRPILDQMYDNSRGIQPISVAITPGFYRGRGTAARVLASRTGWSGRTSGALRVDRRSRTRARTAAQCQVHPQARAGAPRAGTPLVRPRPSPSSSPCR